jgi:hypothetical protein
MQRRAIHLLGCGRAPASVLYVRLFFGGVYVKSISWTYLSRSDLHDGGAGRHEGRRPRSIGARRNRPPCGSFLRVLRMFGCDL